MPEALTIALREGLQCSAILAPVLLYLRSKGLDRLFINTVAGTALAFVAGFGMGYIPALGESLPPNEWWTSLRHASEVALLFSSILFIVIKITPRPGSIGLMLFLIGFVLFFFEARSLGFVLLDSGVLAESPRKVLAAGLAGLALGFAPLAMLRKLSYRLKVPDSLTAATLLIATGVLKFAMGGVGEIGDNGLIIALQNGFMEFLGQAAFHTRSIFLISEHPFIASPLGGLIDFLSSDRVAMTLVVLLVCAPPLYALAHYLAKPDPLVEHIEVPAKRRLNIAIFRRGLVLRAAPVLVSIIVIFIMLHSANASLNPVFEPKATPVTEFDDQGVLRISIAEDSSEATVGKLMKFVYYYGTEQVSFLAIIKSDGTVGLGLDECEICKPPAWNKAAKGYAQRGDKLMCKYCMTPIAVSSVNNPGGCNPIPIPFGLDGTTVVIKIDDLISTWKETKALDKKGSHL